MASASASPAAAMQPVRKTGDRSRLHARPIAAKAKAQTTPAAIAGEITSKRKVSSQTMGVRISAEVPA